MYRHTDKLLHDRVKSGVVRCAKNSFIKDYSPWNTFTVRVKLKEHVWEIVIIASPNLTITINQSSWDSSYNIVM